MAVTRTKWLRYLEDLQLSRQTGFNRYFKNLSSTFYTQCFFSWCMNFFPSLAFWSKHLSHFEQPSLASLPLQEHWKCHQNITIKERFQLLSLSTILLNGWKWTRKLQWRKSILGIQLGYYTKLELDFFLFWLQHGLLITWVQPKNKQIIASFQNPWKKWHSRKEMPVWQMHGQASPLQSEIILTVGQKRKKSSQQKNKSKEH